VTQCASFGNEAARVVALVGAEREASLRAGRMTPAPAAILPIAAALAFVALFGLWRIRIV